MRETKRMRHIWLLLAAAMVAAGLIVVVGCGSDDNKDSGGGGNASTTSTSGGGGGGTIKVGILSDCEGAFADFYEPDIGGAQVPLINRGAKAKDPKKPSAGLTGAKVAGKNIEIVGYGCSDDTADKAIEETRRLVEQLGAQILIGPLSGDEGIAVANYSKSQPDKTFVNGTSGAQDTTLKVRSPNFFRFNSDGAQWSAGLGDYALNKLGWKTAAVIGDDYSFPYTSLAGFIAEFCAIGGDVTKRIWPPLNKEDYSSFISQIPKDVDGLMVGIGGKGLIAFVKQYEQQRGKLDPKKTMGNVFFNDPLIFKEIGKSIVGSTTAGPTAGDAKTPEAAKFVSEVKAAYPDLAPLAASVFVYNYYNNSEAIWQALEQVNGDISDGGKKFREALAKIQLDAGYGPIKLDENRQAIADNYVQKVVSDDKGGYTVQTISKIPQVDQTFGGYFSTTTPAPDRTNPKCEKGTPPPWVGKAEAVQ